MGVAIDFCGAMRDDSGMLAFFAAALAAAPVAPAPPPYRGAATFGLGSHGTTLSFAEHSDGTLAVRIGDTIGSMACALPDHASVVSIRTMLLDMSEAWFSDENVTLSPVLVQPAHAASGCEFRAYTRGHRVYIEAARLDGGVRVDLVTAELSPISVSHTIVDTQTVQRVEDNADAVHLVQAAAALAAGVAGTTTAHGEGSAALDGTAALFSTAAGVASGDIEDTSTRYLHVIEAHTDLALSVIVLDTYLYGGHLPRNEDIDAGYRIRDILAEPSPAFFCRILSRLAAGQSASVILTGLRACGEDRPPIECLP
jgi:hypothetical protein